MFWSPDEGREIAGRDFFTGEAGSDCAAPIVYDDGDIMQTRFGHGCVWYLGGGKGMRDVATEIRANVSIAAQSPRRRGKNGR